MNLSPLQVLRTLSLFSIPPPGLELNNLLPSPHEYWNYRPISQHPVPLIFFCANTCLVKYKLTEAEQRTHDSKFTRQKNVRVSLDKLEVTVCNLSVTLLNFFVCVPGNTLLFSSRDTQHRSETGNC